MYAGMIRLSLALLAMLALFLGACQMLSLMQEQRGWYPKLVKVMHSRLLLHNHSYFKHRCHCKVAANMLQ
jgi:hypothetical protein